MLPWSSIATSPPFQAIINRSGRSPRLCRNYSTSRINDPVRPPSWTLGLPSDDRQGESGVTGDPDSRSVSCPTERKEALTRFCSPINAIPITSDSAHVDRGNVLRFAPAWPRQTPSATQSLWDYHAGVCHGQFYVETNLVFSDKFSESSKMYFRISNTFLFVKVYDRGTYVFVLRFTWYFLYTVSALHGREMKYNERFLLLEKRRILECSKTSHAFSDWRIINL